MADDQEYPVSWIILSSVVACCNFLASASCLFAFQALLRNSSVRQNAYNIYVIFLIFPDGLQSLFVGLWVAFLQRMPQGYFEINCFVWYFYFVSNFYLNGVVAYEINKLATASYRRKKTSPPKLGRAWKQVTMVYVFAIVISLWCILPYKWALMNIDDNVRGTIKFGSPDGGFFGVLGSQLTSFVIIGIPITYVLYIRIRFAWHKLLPKRGRTRVLSMFFLRIIIVFLLFYLPNTILNAALVALNDDPDPVPRFWIGKVGTPLLTACQACVTLYMVMSKDDIRKAVANAWNECFGKCCCRIATSVQRRASAGPVNFTNSRRTGDSNFNSGLSTRPPSLSASYHTEPALPKKSEWEQEDLYSERPPHLDPTARELDQENSSDTPDEESKEEEDMGLAETIEEANSFQRDEAQHDNCRDVTDAWVKQQVTPSVDANQDLDHRV